MIDGLKPGKKKEKKLSKIEQELIKENERLQAVIIQVTKEHLELKKSMGIGVKSRFSEQEKQDILAFIAHIKKLTGISVTRLIKQIDMNVSTYYKWRQRRALNRLSDKKPVGRNPLRLLEWEKEIFI